MKLAGVAVAALLITAVALEPAAASGAMLEAKIVKNVPFRCAEETSAVSARGDLIIWCNTGRGGNQVLRVSGSRRIARTVVPSVDATDVIKDRFRTGVSPLPQEDGSVTVATRRRVFHVAANGAVRAVYSVPDGRVETIYGLAGSVERGLWVLISSRTGAGSAAVRVSGSEIREVPLPEPANFAPAPLEASPDGSAWVTLADGVARVDPDGNVAQVAGGQLQPKVCHVDAQGRAYGTAGGIRRLARYTPGEPLMVLTTTESRAYQWCPALGADGNFWYASFDRASDAVHRVTPDGQRTNFNTPRLRLGCAPRRYLARPRLGMMLAGPKSSLWSSGVGCSLVQITMSGRVSLHPTRRSSQLATPVNSVVAASRSTVWATGFKRKGGRALVALKP